MFGGRWAALCRVVDFSSQDRILQRIVEHFVRCFRVADDTSVGARSKIELQDRTQRRTHMQINDISVLQELEEVFTQFLQDKVHRFGKQIFEIPTISFAEKISEKVENTHVQHVLNTVNLMKPSIIKMLSNVH